MKYFKIPKPCQCRNTTTGLMNQSNKFYGFQHELVDRYEMSILLKWHWIFFTYRRLFRSSITDKTNTGLDCMCNSGATRYRQFRHTLENLRGNQV
jgi:hypothetical protein